MHLTRIMSDRRPPEPPPSPKGNKKSSPKDSGGGGFNWRVLILFGIASAVLWAAYHLHAGAGTKSFDFAEFKKQHYAENLYQKDQFAGDDETNKAIRTHYKLTDEMQEQFVPKFVTEKSASIGHLRGKFNYLDTRDLDKVKSETPFIAELNSPADHEIFQEIPNTQIKEYSYVDNIDRG